MNKIYKSMMNEIYAPLCHRVEESTHGWLNMSSIFVAFCLVSLQRYDVMPIIERFSGDGEEGTFNVTVHVSEVLTLCFTFSQGSGSYFIDLNGYGHSIEHPSYSYGDGLYKWLNDFFDKVERFALGSN